MKVIKIVQKNFESFLEGWMMIYDLSPDIRVSVSDDNDEIASDWENIGGDFKKVISRYGAEKD